MADGMISLLIVSLSAIMISALVQMKQSSETAIRNTVLEYDDEYENRIREIGDCEITCPDYSAEPE
ncbi:MAG: hypothetical protein GX481_08995, partial [Atopobium sp.]|nr:hypothetical protein [Atopobium sp.]